MDVTSTRIQTDLLLSWTYNTTEGDEKDNNICWDSNGKKKRRRLQINASSLSSAIRTEVQRSVSPFIASIVVLKYQMNHEIFLTCRQFGLSSNIASYSVMRPQIAPRKFETIRGVLRRYLTRITKFVPQAVSSISCWIPQRNHSEHTRNVRRRKTILVQFTAAMLIKTQHSLSVIWSVENKIPGICGGDKEIPPKHLKYDARSFKNCCSPACQMKHNAYLELFTSSEPLLMLYLLWNSVRLKILRVRDDIIKVVFNPLYSRLVQCRRSNQSFVISIAGTIPGHNLQTQLTDLSECFRSRQKGTKSPQWSLSSELLNFRPRISVFRN